MTMEKYQVAKQALLHFANIVSPTGKEQAAFAKMILDLEQDGEDCLNIIRVVTGTVYDGLKFGNWPR